jgi:UDP-N-acetylmuramyl pentapeptide synthase
MSLKKVQNALAWRLRSLVGDKAVDRLMVAAARAWRPCIRKPVFIGVSGSFGKTTTKELLVSMLSQGLRGTGNPESLNVLPEVAKTLLRVRPGHDFCVAELSEGQPGALDAPLALFRPQVGVVTVIGNDHLDEFASRDQVAHEVEKLVAAIPVNGTAVLNADDPHVLAMAKTCKGGVITFGTSAAAKLRASDVSSNWPERLTFTLEYGAQQLQVRSQLCGEHWLPSLLGAIGAGLAIGLTLPECAAKIGKVLPFTGRMQPVAMPDGVTFLRDDFKGSLWTIPPAIDFVRNAQATRKIMVIASPTHSGPDAEKAYLGVAEQAATVADQTILVGRAGATVHSLLAENLKPSVHAFTGVREIADYFDTLLESGDLVLLKGSNKMDHLSRILLSRESKIACWRNDCVLQRFCSDCSLLYRPCSNP